MDARKERALTTQVVPAILAAPHLDESKLDAMLAIAAASLALHLKPATGSSTVWQFREQDVKDLIEELSRREGFRKSATDVNRLQEDFREASILERLKAANRNADRQ